MGARESRKGEIERIAFMLCHPLRVQLIREYAGRSASPSELASSLGRDLGLVSHHTNVLFAEGDGLLEVTGRKQVRGARATFYQLKSWGQRTGLNAGNMPLQEVVRLAQLELLIEVVAASPVDLAESYISNGVALLGHKEQAALAQDVLPKLFHEDRRDGDPPRDHAAPPDIPKGSGGTDRKAYVYGVSLLPKVSRRP